MLRNFLFIISLWVFVSDLETAWADDRESRVVETLQGPVRGYKDPDSGLFTFKSIPYASVPTGPNRFKAPLPPPVWLQPLEAVDKGIICPQVAFPLMPANTFMQEDCLIANVYVPDTEETNLPVYVYVHGGGFQLGYGDWVKPVSMLTEHNIISVTFNYRLGVHGFLCLGTEDVPGNAGMKDQVALLRWVKKNIASFGGNPDDVTIGGCSAGGASVDLLILSKSAEGLFNKAIPESGANLAAFATQVDPLENAKWFANYLNFTNADDIYALQDFYKTTPYEKLNIDSFFTRTDSSLVFAPCVERPTGTEMFLDDHPLNILTNGNYRKIPLLYGFADKEGLAKVDAFGSELERLNSNFSDYLPANLKFGSKAEREDVAKTIKEFYFGDKQIKEDGILGYINLNSDIMFVYPHLRSIGLHLDNGHDQIYLYEYSFVDENDPVIPNTNVRGANHCFQAVAVCDGNTPLHLTEVKYTKEYLQMSSLMKQLWANFIKTGKPVPEGSPLQEWPAVLSKDGAPHMSLSNKIVLKGPLAEQRVAFWHKIYQKHYREPIPPPQPPAVIKTRSEL